MRSRPMVEGRDAPGPMYAKRCARYVRRVTRRTASSCELFAEPGWPETEAPAPSGDQVQCAENAAQAGSWRSWCAQECRCSMNTRSEPALWAIAIPRPAAVTAIPSAIAFMKCGALCPASITSICLRIGKAAVADIGIDNPGSSQDALLGCLGDSSWQHEFAHRAPE